MRTPQFSTLSFLSLSVCLSLPDLFSPPFHSELLPQEKQSEERRETFQTWVLPLI